MADLKETAVWGPVRQIETSDPVLGGENGVSNTAPRQLANRDLYLKTNLDVLTVTVTGLGTNKANKATTLIGYGITDAYNITQSNALLGDKIPYMGATKAVNLNGKELTNTGTISLGDGANNQYQALMLGNYTKAVANENYGVVHNTRFVTGSLLRFTTLSTFNAVGEHVSSLFASDTAAILRLNETNYAIALAKDVANKNVEIEAGTGLTGGGDLTASRTLNIDKATVSNVNNAVADKVVTADVLLPFLAARVADTRSISSGTGLTGGGNLTENRTFAIDKSSLAELNAGTANKVVTADVLQQAFANTKNENGYTKLANGMVMQWGKVAVVDETKSIAIYAVTFPISFPAACLNISISKLDGGGNDVFNIMNNPAPTKTGFSFGISDKGVNPITNGHLYWFAIGY